MGRPEYKSNRKDKSDAARRKEQAKQAEQTRDVTEACKAKEAQQKKQAEQQSQGKSADTRSGKAGDKTKPADKQPDAPRPKSQAEQTRDSAEARKAKEAQPAKQAEQTESAARPPDVSAQKSYKDDVFRPGISDQLPRSRPSDAGPGLIFGDHPPVGPEQEKTYADQGSVYRPGVSDRPPQGRPGGAGDVSPARSDAAQSIGEPTDWLHKAERKIPEDSIIERYYVRDKLTVYRWTDDDTSQTLVEEGTGRAHKKITFRDGDVIDVGEPKETGTSRTRQEGQRPERRAPERELAAKPGSERARLRGRLEGLEDLSPESRAALEVGAHRWDRGFELDDRLYLPDAVEMSVRWISKDDIPEGVTRVVDGRLSSLDAKSKKGASSHLKTNYWVQRQGYEVWAGPRFPEDAATIKTEFRQMTGKEPDARQTRQIKKANEVLNRDVEFFLREGHTLKSALKKTLKAHRDMLRRILAMIPRR